MIPSSSSATLRHLHISSTDPTIVGTMPKKSHKIGSNRALVLSEAPKSNLTLTTLDVSDYSLGSIGAQILVETLKIDLIATKSLVLSSIDDKRTQALVEGLNSKNGPGQFELEWKFNWRQWSSGTV